MIGLKIGIFSCLLIYVVCQKQPNTESDSQSSATESSSSGSPSIETEPETELTEINLSSSPNSPSIETDSTTESTPVDRSLSSSPGSRAIETDSTTESTPSGRSLSSSQSSRAIETDLITVPDEDTSPDNNSSWPTDLGNNTGTSIGSSDIVITGSVDDEDNFTLIYYNNTDITTLVTTEEPVVTACLSDPCRNGGTCIDDAVNSFLFSCICPAGYVGIRCGTVDKCVEDENGDLCKNRTCVYSKDGLSRYCQCFSGTYWDGDSKECREPDPPCFPNPCLNGGECLIEDDKWQCNCLQGFQGNNCSVQLKCGNCENGACVLNDKRTTKYCKCNEGFYWNKEEQICTAMVSPCDSNPCFNGGACNATSDTEYNCTCEVGFSGMFCEVLDMCSTHEDCRHGACVLSDDQKTRSCHCDSGYYLSRHHTCEAITNVCQQNPCLNDGICLPLSATAFNCTCSEGYTGATCNIRDLCKMDGGDSYCNNGLCDNNFKLGVYYCTCKDKEYFQYAERKCVELDLCPLMQCSTTEKCSLGKCECKTNYKHDNVTKKCEPDFCSSKPCPLPEMICAEGTGDTDYKCSCKDGYTFNGTHCNVGVCIFPKLNSCGQTCSQYEGNYECHCEDEFMLKEDNHTCQYTGNYTCLNKTCTNGVCVERNEMEVCLCPPGYVEVKGKCIDICTNGSLPKGVCPLDKCETTIESGFRCKCEGKFVLANDQVTCIERNVCQVNEIGWKTCASRNAKCVKDRKATEGFICTCSTGKVLTNGICQDICSLESNQILCSNKGATCEVNAKGKTICKCPPYFKEIENNGKCTQPADFSYLITLPLDESTYKAGNRNRRSLDDSVDYWKISKDVTITMQGMFAEFTQANVLSCKSTEGYIFCKIELQFSSAPKSDLKRLETEDVCLSNGNSNSCLLPPLLVLVKNRISKEVTIKATDPCEEDIKEKACGSDTTCTSSLSLKSFNCSCKPGFLSRRKTYPFSDTKSFIESCIDIDECSEGDPCTTNSICVNTIGNYTCSCKLGFRSVKDDSGSTSEKCVGLCNPNPCTHGICSTRGDHEFDCKCEAGFRGTFCDLHDENFKRARTNTIIVGVVLGGVLLITFILFAVCVSRLKKRKYLENPGHMYYNSAEMTERRRGEGGAVNNAFQRE